MKFIDLLLYHKKGINLPYQGVSKICLFNFIAVPCRILPYHAVSI